MADQQDIGWLFKKLEELQQQDDLPENFDWSTIMGEIANEVDAIKFAVDKLEARAKGKAAEAVELAKRFVDPILKESKIAANRASALEKFLFRHMEAHGIAKLCGSKFDAKIQKSNPAFVMDQEIATVDDFNGELGQKGYVTTKRIFEFDIEKIKADLKAKIPVSFARFTQSSHIRFPAHKESKE